MIVTGRITAVGHVASGTSRTTGKQWATQDFTIEFFEQPSDRYPDSMAVTFVGSDRISEFNPQVGEEVTVTVGHSSREYNGRYYNEIRCYGYKRQTQPNVNPAQQYNGQRGGVPSFQQTMQPSPNGQAIQPQANAQMRPTQDNDDQPF